MAAEGHMRYVSTRGGMPPATFCEVLLEGLAPDGGLIVPERYAVLSSAELAAMRPLDYSQLALAIIGRYADDIPGADLERVIRHAYRDEVFHSPEVTPLRCLESGVYLLQLANGPTLAFKDVAMQLLGELFEYVLARTGRSLNILGDLG